MLKLTTLAMLISLPALAHDGMHDAWFEILKRPDTGGSCCNLYDCKATEAELHGGHWRARTPSGAWVEVPDDLIIHDKGNPVGQPILCGQANPYRGGKFNVYCFVPGALI